MNAPNALANHPGTEIGLVEFIDFKWLMAGVGHKVHLQRLQDDADYARACLGCGAQAAEPALRAASRRLAQAMGISLLP